ncbi:branched-chain amino acid ABC transporter permease [uncultured Desulfosarcina sp.]|uniref:branched-chain amino acid ABC transporter permease n=1 Tax=uncultured Desulfosarcina sp. TaxID=218289 RepID=UPI0029C98253|nr:branched-chain amino acid ABC transporter permease [uncultured Desulfosarcina sp.]
MYKKNYSNLGMRGILVLFAGIAIPLIFPAYRVLLVTEAIIFSLFAVSFNLLLGYAGLLSFGHAMFFGTSAYITAIVLGKMTGCPLLVAVLIAVLATTAISFLSGILLLRHKGHYFALLTLAFNSLFYALATKWHSITGGDDGLSVPRPDVSLGFTKLNMSDITTFYFFTLIIIGMTLLFCWYFTKTAMGQTVCLIRENEERMKFLGYNTNISRLYLFTFTGSLAGFAGSFYAIFFQFTSITAISIDMSTTVLLMTFIGGTGTFIGPIIGAFVFTFLQDYLSDITDRWPLIMGFIFIFMVLYIPGGLSNIFISIKNRLLGHRNSTGNFETER